MSNDIILLLKFRSYTLSNVKKNIFAYLSTMREASYKQLASRTAATPSHLRARRPLHTLAILWLATATTYI